MRGRRARTPEGAQGTSWGIPTGGERVTAREGDGERRAGVQSLGQEKGQCTERRCAGTSWQRASLQRAAPRAIGDCSDHIVLVPGLADRVKHSLQQQVSRDKNRTFPTVSDCVTGIRTVSIATLRRSVRPSAGLDQTTVERAALSRYPPSHPSPAAPEHIMHDNTQGRVVVGKKLYGIASVWPPPGTPRPKSGKSDK